MMEERHTDTNTLDGNAAGGVLGTIFAGDATTMTAICDHCGSPSMVGQMATYVTAMGTVLRCPSCEGVLLRVMQSRGVYRFDTGGVRQFLSAPVHL